MVRLAYHTLSALAFPSSLANGWRGGAQPAGSGPPSTWECEGWRAAAGGDDSGEGGRRRRRSRRRAWLTGMAKAWVGRSAMMARKRWRQTPWTKEKRYRQRDSRRCRWQGDLVAGGGRRVASGGEIRHARYPQWPSDRCSPCPATGVARSAPATPIAGHRVCPSRQHLRDREILRGRGERYRWECMTDGPHYFLKKENADWISRVRQIGQNSFG